LNKIDLLSPAQRAGSSPTPEYGGPWDALTSALTGEGIERLIAAIGRRLVPAPPATAGTRRGGSAVPFTAEQIDRLIASRAAAERRDGAALAECLQPLLAD
jgi:hypothetical protein